MVKSESEKSNQQETKSSKGKSDEKTYSYGPSTEESIDKIGVIFDKGINLVETGLELGVNLVSKLGGVATDKASDILKTGMNEAGGQKDTIEDIIRQYAGQVREQSPPEPQPEPQPEPRQEQAPPLPVVSNRLPAFPGGAVKIAFSIENESVKEAKQLQFSMSGHFIGEESKFRIETGAFKMSPSKKSIAPMDFEKVVLSGKIPEKAPSDVYKGFINVSGKDRYQIPLALIVSQPR